MSLCLTKSVPHDRFADTKFRSQHLKSQNPCLTKNAYSLFTYLFCQTNPKVLGTAQDHYRRTPTPLRCLTFFARQKPHTKNPLPLFLLEFRGSAVQLLFRRRAHRASSELAPDPRPYPSPCCVLKPAQRPRGFSFLRQLFAKEDPSGLCSPCCKPEESFFAKRVERTSL